MIITSKKFIPALIIALALVACGKKEEAQTATTTAQPAAETAKPSESAKPADSAAEDPALIGEKVFKATCSMCHQTGAAGAPIIAKKDEWAPRIAQGMPTLYDHAIKGFTGKKGMMPPKGANPSLSDDKVKAAVDYMVNKSK